MVGAEHQRCDDGDQRPLEHPLAGARDRRRGRGSTQEERQPATSCEPRWAAPSASATTAGSPQSATADVSAPRRRADERTAGERGRRSGAGRRRSCRRGRSSPPFARIRHTSQASAAMPTAKPTATSSGRPPSQIVSTAIARHHGDDGGPQPPAGHQDGDRRQPDRPDADHAAVLGGGRHRHRSPVRDQHHEQRRRAQRGRDRPARAPRLRGADLRGRAASASAMRGRRPRSAGDERRSRSIDPSRPVDPCRRQAEHRADALAAGGAPGRPYGVGMTSAARQYDVVVVGGGHNGLVAAAYLARAGALGAGARAARPHRRRRGLGHGVPRPARPGSRASPTWSRCCPTRIVDDLGLDLDLASRRDGVLHADAARREARRAAGRARRGRRPPGSRSATSPAPTRSTTPGGGFYADVGTLAAGRRPDAHRAAAARGRRSATRSTPAVADLVDRPARRGRRAPLRRRHRARRRGHRRADRHLRLAARPVADPEPLLPLPPGRQRHRRVAGAGRRHGRGHRRAAPGRRRRRRRDPHRRPG